MTREGTDSGPRVFLASRNPGKVAEMRRLLDEVVPGVEVLGIKDVSDYDEPAESEPTFEGNARLKAIAGVEATGLPSLADDSGLCVDALNSMPGVLSARWSGAVRNDQANNALLLAQLSDTPGERRGAQFRCAVVLRLPNGCEQIATGEMRGRIGHESVGTGGFGYDAVFVPEGLDRTSAELTPEEKDAISHRGQAVRAMAPLVAETLGVR
ncbi:MAG: RdgB/HAM1 family non-canonical purine NTP pyrophosphatase [Nocardioidaceae bacterium]